MSATLPVLIFIVAVLVAMGFFFPVIWIVAAALVVVVAAYAWVAARRAAGESERNLP